MTKRVDRDAEIERLSEDSLRDRLKLAEDVCVLFGWTASQRNTPTEAAAERAWMDWAKYVGSERAEVRANRRLDELSK